MAVAKEIIDNVRDTKIVDFLRKENVEKNSDELGMDLYIWLGKIIDENRISIEKINKVLFQELEYGDRRLIRIYQLKGTRKIKKEKDWEDFLKNYSCPSMNFNRIVETTLCEDDKIKVAAVKSNISEKTVNKVDILFVYKMYTRSSEGTQKFIYSYLPVSVDVKNKILSIKVWNREEGEENNTPIDQIDDIFRKLQKDLQFDTQALESNSQAVLYKMSKALFDDFFKKLPNINEIENKKTEIPQLVNDLLLGIKLQNIENQGNKIAMNTEVIDVKEEMYKLLQQVALYDYLKDHSIKNLLKNTDKYISRIRFNDRDNLTASLTSEKGVKCIFDAKTFMCVRNSFDLVESIVAIVVTFTKKRGLLSVKYDASDRRYLNIHVLNNRYYTADDFNKIWELYKKYESGENAIADSVYNENNIAAM